jgi:hypothetical protein
VVSSSVLAPFTDVIKSTDLKCTFTIIDHSNHEMKVDFFEKAVEDMPPRPNLGDLVLIRNIKVSAHVLFSPPFFSLFRPNGISQPCRS